MSTGKKTALIIGAVILFCCCGGGTPFVFWNPFNINLGSPRHQVRNSPTHDSSARTVRMEVTGTAPTASVTWILPSSSHSGEEVTLPWSKTVSTPTTAGPMLLAAEAPGATLTCRMYVNDKLTHQEEAQDSVSCPRPSSP